MKKLPFFCVICFLFLFTGGISFAEGYLEITIHSYPLGTKIPFLESLPYNSKLAKLTEFEFWTADDFLATQITVIQIKECFKKDCEFKKIRIIIK